MPIPIGVWSVAHLPATPTTIAVNARADGRIGSGVDPRLRLWLSRGELRGFWVTPAAGGSGTGYATPIRVVERSPRGWVVTYTPLDNAPQVHFIALHAANGNDEAFISDPIANVGASVGMLQAVRDANGVRWNDARGATIATYDPVADAVRITLPNANPAIAERDRMGIDAVPSANDRALLDDAPRDDYWSTATPSAMNLTDAPLVQLARALSNTSVTSVHAPNIQSMLVARGRTIVFERYFSGFNAMRAHDLRSASKSLTPVLVGVAMQQSARIAETMPITSFFHYASYANDAPAKHAITLADALAMNTGLACDDYDDNSPGGEDRMQATSDWYKFVLDLHQDSAPGARAAYCSGGINLAVGAVAAATHEWTPRLFYERLALPMHLSGYALPTTPQGELYGGGGIWMRPRDFMKFGRLYVQRGVWNGRRLLPETWIARTIAMHSVMNGDDTYGYGWHLRTYRIGTRDFHSFEAGGNGGQLLAVFPDDDLEVMMTAANYGDFRVWKNFRDYITTYVLPAVRS